MTTSYLVRGEGRIAYDVQGDGPLVVCLPGMGDLRSVFRFLVPALVGAGYRVSTMDLRGHGDSDDGFSAYDDVAAGQDALALIDHLEPAGGRALLVGNSMSAGASVWAAAQAPDRVAGLTLIGPFVRNPDTSAIMKLLLRVAMVKPWGPTAWQAYLKSAYPGRPPADFAEYRRAVGASLRRGDHWRSFVRTTRTTHAPAEARIGEVTAPALVVMGERDPDWSDPPAEARWVADALKAELLLVPSAGHYPMAEYPEVVNPAVVAFAQRVHVRA
jgi:pimeloyl-ACP methyl ester carboxylesterase